MKTTAASNAYEPRFLDSYADANGTRLHYVSAGEGKLILFLHGFPEFWYAWKDQLAHFAPNFRAVAPDLRGYNLSSKPPAIADYRLTELVADIRSFAAQITDERFVLVGHDWGGFLAWVYAARHPDCIDKLVILNAPHPSILERELRENTAQQLASAYFDAFSIPETPERQMSADNFAALAKIVFEEGLKDGYRTESDLEEYRRAWSQPGALTSSVNYYRANLGLGSKQNGFWSMQKAMPEIASTLINAPTLVLWGMQDPYLLAGNLSGLERFVPNLKVKLFADAGHWIVQQKRDEVNLAIGEFVA